MEAFKVFVEKEGKPFNYMTQDQEDEKDRIARLVEYEKKKKTEDEKQKEM